MILIVDDHEAIGAGLQRLIRRAGHEAVAVTSGADALAMMRVRKPDLVVLDVNMPDMDGMTMLKTIKEGTELNDVPIAMHSANRDPAVAREAKRLGAVDFLAKGRTDYGKLVARICELAGRPA